MEKFCGIFGAPEKVAFGECYDSIIVWMEEVLFFFMSTTTVANSFSAHAPLMDIPNIVFLQIVMTPVSRTWSFRVDSYRKTNPTLLAQHNNYIVFKTLSNICETLLKQKYRNEAFLLETLLTGPKTKVNSSNILL